MRKYFCIKKTFFKYCIYGVFIGLCAFFVGSFFFAKGFGSFDVNKFSLFQIYGISLTLFNFYYFRYVKFYFYNAGNLLFRFFTSFLGAAVLNFLLFFLLKFGMSLYYDSLSKLDNTDYYLFCFFITISAVLFFHLISVLREKQKLINEIKFAQLHTLKEQLNPHFVFNNLNILSSLVTQDTQKSKEYIHYFSKVYRYVLDSLDENLTLLSEELNFAKYYLKLMKIRFGKAIFFDIQEDLFKEQPMYVVSFSLQILLENAFKHNISSLESPLEIKIYKEKDFLVIANNVQPSKKPLTKAAWGLKSIKKRYAFFTAKKIIVEKTDRFVVKIPLLNLKK